MKMEGTNSDILKLSSSKASADTGGLTFGPAWLRQLSSGDSTKMSALPPSPGLAFQLAKHRYGREEMLAIYETIEKALFTQPAPTSLANDFEDLFKKELQRPVLLTQPSLEEQKFLSTCVNSLAALNSYNKLQSGPAHLSSNSSTNTSSTSNQSGRQNSESIPGRGGSNSTRGSRGGSLSGQTGRGGSYSSGPTGERGGGGGRGRGRGRGTDSSHVHKPALDEDGNPIPVSSSTRGSGRGGYNRGSYTRSNNSGNWDERELGGEKKYSRAMADDNWRSKASISESDEPDHEKELSSSPPDEIKEENENNETSHSNDFKRSETSEKPNRSWRNSNSSQSTNREWPSYKKQYNNETKSRNSNNYDSTNKKSSHINDHPEWLNDDEDETETSDENLGKSRMTFDESGKFVAVKDLKTDKPKEELNKKQLSENTSTETEKKTVEKSENTTKKHEPAEQDVTSSSSSQSKQDLLNNQNLDLNLNEKSNHEQLLSNLVNQTQSLNLSNQNLDPNTLKNLLQLTNPDFLSQQQKPTQQTSQIHNTDPKLGAVQAEHPDADRWFYLDPQNQIQGPFSSEQMAGWFAAGYFSMNLMIKRGCDEKFLPLGGLTQNLGRIPFSSSSTQPQPQQQQQQQTQNITKQTQAHPQQQQQQLQTWSKDQILQQIQLFQQMQQMQFFPQNFNLLQNSGLNNSNLSALLQQLQQLQLQQKAAVASVNNLGVNAVSAILNDLRLQQEALINQVNSNNKQTNQQNNQQPNNKGQDPNVLTVLDPAILDAGLPNQSIWGDVQATNSRISPMPNAGLNPTPPPVPSSISPINNLLQQAASNNPLASILNNQLLSANAANILGHHQFADNNPIKDKIQALFEQTKKDEERRKKLEEEYKMKLKREEEERRRLMDDARLKQQQEEMLRRAEEERLREEIRKEQQKKKLEEIIKNQEEEKRKQDEMKKKKEEEKKKNEELKKQKEEQKRLEQIQKQQQEEAEKKRLLEQAEQQARKQAELERQKQKQQQDQLNNLQLPSHAQWAKQQSNVQQLPNVELKKILEQQALEQKLLMELKEKEAITNQSQGQNSTWSSLFRGQQQSPPTSIQQAHTISLASIQAEQTRTSEITQKQTMSQKIQQTKPVPAQKAINSNNPWSAWGNSGNSNTNTKSNENNSVGFWGEVNNEHSKQIQQQQQAKNLNNNKTNNNNNNNNKIQVPRETYSNHQNESTKSKKVEESVHKTFLRDMKISDEFMKWCHEQLKDFQVELHIPTFVNFLREIETCAEIEDYVINYLGDSKQAKDFAQQFFVNRESQLSQQNSRETINDDPNSQFSLKEAQFLTKQKQKRRSKGQKLDSQLLGFTVQADPNLKNRGDIDTL